MNVFVTFQVADRELLNESANRNAMVNKLRDKMDQEKWMSDFPETFEMDVWDASLLLRILGVLSRTNTLLITQKVA